LHGKPFEMGIYLEPGDFSDPTGIPEQLAAQQFNHRVITGTDLRACKGEGQWDFGWTDFLLQKASLANQSMIGGLLWSWEGSIPDWVKNGGYTRDHLVAIVESHIATTLSRYRGRIGAYIVVNEAFRPGLGTTGDWWEQHIGPDYVHIAFQKARQVDPDAVLIYNHYRNHTKSGWNYSITKRDVDDLEAHGLIDAVGLQLHLWQDWPRPTKADVIEAMQSYGLSVWVTEFDCYQISVQGVSNPEEEQALVTTDMIRAALESGVCHHFTNWGISDKNSVWGASAKACLWDENNNAKLNYYAIQQVLASRITLINDAFLPLIMR
jgi:endo-1,4-beta-xylanase